jgi:voltage-gated potassium channel
MAKKAARSSELKNLGYELFIAGLSILSIFNLVLLYVAQDEDIKTVLWIMNGVMTPIFLGDFAFRLHTAPSKSGYFFRQYGWADLISSLPFPQLKILRVTRLWRLIRLWREFGSDILREFIRHRAENALLTVGFLVLCVLEFGSLAELFVEQNAEGANIKTASDAIWWTYVTITTVGYGDYYPVTNEGRIIALLVMTAGVGLFGTLSGYLANAFLSPTDADAETPDEAAASEPATPVPDASDPRAQLAEVQRMVAAQETALAELRASLDGLEKAL